VEKLRIFPDGGGLREPSREETIESFSRTVVGWLASMVKDPALSETCLFVVLLRRDYAGRPVCLSQWITALQNQIHAQLIHRHSCVEGLVGSVGSVSNAFGNAAAKTVMRFSESGDVANGSTSRAPHV
jgi:hypothetical protein